MPQYFINCKLQSVRFRLPSYPPGTRKVIPVLREFLTDPPLGPGKLPPILPCPLACKLFICTSVYVDFRPVSYLAAGLKNLPDEVCFLLRLVTQQVTAQGCWSVTTRFSISRLHLALTQEVLIL